MRIGIAGIGGRIGSLLPDLIAAAGHTLAGGIGRPSANTPMIDDLAARSDVVIDFSDAASTARHAASLARARTAWVLGTTGFDAACQAAIDTAAATIPIVQAANFSLGANLLIELARVAAQPLPDADYDAEILETPHRHKRDAPSGTALAIGRAVAAARARSLDDVAVQARSGQTGPRPPGAIGFAVQRAGLVVGEHALSFTGSSERFVLAHEAFDRRVFAEGALHAALWLHGRPPGRYSMGDILAIPSLA